MTNPNLKSDILKISVLLPIAGLFAAAGQGDAAAALLACWGWFLWSVTR